MRHLRLSALIILAVIVFAVASGLAFVGRLASANQPTPSARVSASVMLDTLAHPVARITGEFDGVSSVQSSSLVDDLGDMSLTRDDLGSQYGDPTLVIDEPIGPEEVDPACAPVSAQALANSEWKGGYYRAYASPAGKELFDSSTPAGDGEFLWAQSVLFLLGDKTQASNVFSGFVTDLSPHVCGTTTWGSHQSDQFNPPAICDAAAGAVLSGSQAGHQWTYTEVMIRRGALVVRAAVSRYGVNFPSTSDATTLAEDLCARIDSVAASRWGPAVLFISGVPSDGECGVDEDDWGWAGDALTGIVANDQVHMLRYVYTSGTEAVGQCMGGSWDKSDSCWSLNDTYIDIWLRDLERDGQAQRLKAFIHNHLAKNPGIKLSIVAHSQGGVLATYVVKELLSSDDQKRIETVITLDSPLRGVSNGAPLLFWFDGPKCGQGLSAEFDSPQDMVCNGGGEIYQGICSDVIDGINTGKRVAPVNIHLLTVDAEKDDCFQSWACGPAVDAHHSNVQWSNGHLSLDSTNHTQIYDGGGSGADKRVLQSYVACGIARVVFPTKCAEAAERANLIDPIPPSGTLASAHTVPPNTSSLQTVTSTGWSGIAAAAVAGGVGPVTTALISPSNRRIDATTDAPDVEHRLVGDYELFRVANPESGEWTIEFKNTGGASSGEDVHWFATNIPDGSVDGDGDAVRDDSDNCVGVYNVSQSDADEDGIGDDCDTDYDGDGIPNESDNCVFTANVDQLDANANSVGDACDPEVTDLDGDGVPDGLDNCPLFPNSAQTDADGDGAGDSCVPIRGDTDCDQDVDAVDALNALRDVAGLPVSAQCLAGSGDIDCDDGIDAVDALGILRYVASLPVNQPQGCAAIGNEVVTVQVSSGSGGGIVWIVLLAAMPALGLVAGRWRSELR